MKEEERAPLHRCVMTRPALPTHAPCLLTQAAVAVEVVGEMEEEEEEEVGMGFSTLSPIVKKSHSSSPPRGLPPCSLVAVAVAAEE